MKKLFMTFAVGSLVMASSMAQADVMSWIEETEIAANVRVANDYLFYGASQTSGTNGNNNGTSIQGGFDITWTDIGFLNGSLYSGVFAANVEWSRSSDTLVQDYSSIEFTHYHGIAGDSILNTGISWDVGGINYTYPDQSSDAGLPDDFDYWEIYGNFGYSFDDVVLAPSLSAGVYYSPNWFGYDESAYHIPVGLDLSLPYGFTLSGFYGYLELDVSGQADNYSYYGIGLANSILGVDVDVSYTGISDHDDCSIVQTGLIDGNDCGGWVVGVSKAF